MTDSRSYKEKYYKLKEKFENLNKQKEDLKHSLEVNKHRSRRLKEENNRLIDLMMEMNPYLIDEASNSSSSDELLSDATSEDVEDVPMQATNKYEQPKQTLTKESKRKVTSPSSSSARKTTTTRPSPPQPSTASFSSTKSSGKRKAEESVPVEEAQTQKRRRKPTTVKKKRDDRTDAKRIEPLPMNPDDTLKLPVTIGKGTNEVSIHRIGEIVWDREAYHTNRYIFPVGFMSKKQYLSAVDVTRRTTYTSEILDGGDTPIFQITAEDQPGRKFVASSSSGVWKKILDEINVQGVPSKTHASGPEMLGLSHLGITKYIQELPGAEKCTKYVMQRWIDDNDDHHNQYSSPSLQQHPQLQSPTSQQLLQQPPSSASSTTSSSSTFSHMQQQHSLSSSPSNYRHPHHHHHHHHQQQQQMSHNVKTEPLMDEIEDNREIDDDVDDIDDDAFNKDFKSTNGYH